MRILGRNQDMGLVWVIIPLVLFSIVGISESFEASIGSPNFQLESGVASEDITCRDNRVLVLRTNGDLACVKESTSEKLGWTKIEENVVEPADVELDPILYSGGPISSKMIESTSVTDPSISVESTIFPSDSELIISKLPRVDDVIDITFITTYQPIRPHTFENAIVAFYVTDTLEFLTIPEGYELEYTEPQSRFGVDHPGLYKLKTTESVVFDSGIPQVFTVQAKVASEGFTTITAGVFDERTKLDIVIGSTETLLRNDYYIKYPQERPEPVKLPTSPQEQDAFEKKYGVSFGTTTIRTNITEEDYRAWLEDYGMSEDEIKETLERVFPKTIVEMTIASEPNAGFFATASLSNVPNLGETATLTISTYTIYENFNRDGLLAAELPEGFEFVDGDMEFLHNRTNYAGIEYISYAKDVRVIDTIPVETTITIKAVKAGDWTIYVGGVGTSYAFIDLYIDEKDSFQKDEEYYKKQAETKPIKSKQETESETEPPPSDPPKTPPGVKIEPE